MISQVSVVICTHNPRPDYLRRVLDALQAQTLPKSEWELLLIDNASKEPLSGQWDLSWHPAARCVREEELGLTPARLRGIHEARGPLLVFVDDDNVLSSDYLQQAHAISSAWPQLGAWSGQIFPEFECPPEETVIPYLGMLALVQFARDSWSNLKEDAATPFGAGMCIRREIAVHYANAVGNDETRRTLGRRGADLASAEDTDMAFTACDLGYGTGRFAALRLLHLIPKRRLELDYLLRLRESMSLSQTSLLARCKPDFVPPTRARRVADLLRAWTKPQVDRAFKMASFRGRARALQLLGIRSHWI